MKSWGPRACLVYLARVADAAERYDGKPISSDRRSHLMPLVIDLLGFVRQFVQFPGEMTPLERNLFCIAFKNITSQQRFAIRNLAPIQVIAKKSYPDKSRLIAEERERYSQELRDRCNEVLDIIERKLLPSAISNEYRIFCYKT
jgi:14-3-3 protein epsilon